MNKLNLNTFISAANDAELSQYLVLAALKNYTESFHKNKLYPPLGELVQLTHNLNNLKSVKETFNGNLPGKLIGFDLDNKKPVYEQHQISDTGLKKVFEFIEWALPQMDEIINEGKAIYDFVDENIKIEEIGILPIYKDEGYFLIQNSHDESMLAFRFELSIISSSEEPMRSLKVKFIESIEAFITVEDLKLYLVRKYPDLPNPATYNIIIDIDFPFDETIFPVAKRKLMRQLAA